MPCLDGMYIPKGTRLTYVGEFDLSASQINSSLSDADVLQSVFSDLKNSENTLVESYDILRGFLTKTVTLHLLNGSDHGSLGATDGREDIRSIVDHYFWVETNVMPAASRITDYQIPNQEKQTTGAPPPPPPSGKCTPSSNPFTGFNFTPLAWGGLIGIVALGAFAIFLHEF